MKVILKEDVKKLGEVGSIVRVADGYGRNYLIPRNLAVEANPKNIRQFEHDKKQIMARVDEIRKSSEDLATRLSSLNLEIEAKAGEEDKLFGSVTSMQIAEAIAEQGIEVDKRSIALEEPIKRLGDYKVSVKLSQGVTASVSVNVKRAEAPPE
jgi:large subunit ribosomal protein L9